MTRVCNSRKNDYYSHIYSWQHKYHTQNQMEYCYKPLIIICDNVELYKEIMTYYATLKLQANHVGELELTIPTEIYIAGFIIV
jgi:hypothetical protein